MSRILFPVYGVVCYLIFFATFIYMVGFVHNYHFQLGSFYFVPVAIDFGGNAASPNTAFLIDLALIVSIRFSEGDAANLAKGQGAA